MKTLYFYNSLFDKGKIYKHTLSDNEAISIANEFTDDVFINFVTTQAKLIQSGYFEECQNRISTYGIRTILDAVGLTHRFANNGVELNRILLSSSDKIIDLVVMSEHDKNIAKYLRWLMGNYIKFFNYHFGELILIVSDTDDMDFYPDGFNPIKFKTDSRVFYSKHNKPETKNICQVCKINIKQGKIIYLYPSTLLIGCSQLVLQSVDLLGGILKF